MKKMRNVISMIVCIGMIMLQPMQIFAAQNVSEINGEVDLPRENVSEMNEELDLSQKNIQNFLNEYFPRKMEEYHVPGAAIAVVKENEELLTAAYGVQNLETKEPVDCDTTLFPAASVSKLFTATAIMQLYEQGKLDLHQDILSYIPDLKIRNPFEKPITCSDLLTHSSGLDEQSELAGSTLDADQIESQKYYFTKHIPTVIHEPGTVSNYSNMGYNLLGYLVESISGQTYEEYVEKNILNPLSMQDSSVRIPKKECAKGYIYEENEYTEQPLAYQYTSGSSGVITTVKDMEHFMMMHLNGGKYGDNYILREQTEHDMQKKQFANAEFFDGMGYGWIRTHFGKVEVLKHEGALPGYATTMLLIPKENIGIYVATNSQTGICFDFEEAFMQYFYGSEALEGWCRDEGGNDGTKEDLKNNLAGWSEDEGKINNIKEELNDYLGTYRSYDGIARTNLMRIAILFDTTDMKIGLNDDHEITLSVYNQKKELEETTLSYCGKGIFLRRDGKGYIVVERKDNGETYAYTQVSHCSYEKIKWYESKNILVCLWIIVPLCFIISTLLLRKKVCKKSHFCMVAGGVSSVVSVAVVIVMTIMMVYSYDYRGMTMLYILEVINLIGIALMFAGDCINVCKCIRKEYTIKENIAIGIVCISHLVWVMELYYFQLLGMHFM